MPEQELVDLSDSNLLIKINETETNINNMKQRLEFHNLVNNTLLSLICIGISGLFLALFY